jgi:aspartate/methionine/tyrosine aminotransferase
MGVYIDSVPWSGIIRIRDMMFSVKDPFRLDQGDVSFDAPDSVKSAMARAIAENKTHYIQSSGLPRLRELMAAKMRSRNGIPVGDADEVLVTNGGTHALYVMFQALLEPGDEVVLPNPAWPPTVGHAVAAHATPVYVPLRESMGWRYDLDQLRAAITPKTRAIYINSPHNPTGGVLTRADIETIAGIARERNLWVLSDEAYEDVIFNGEHVSIGSLPGMYDRTIPMFTMSKSYAMTGVRVGYLAVKDERVRDRAKKILLYTTSNVCSIAQYGGIGALEGPQEVIPAFGAELRARRDLFYAGIRSLGGIFTGEPPDGAFYAFVRINPSWNGAPENPAASPSWTMAEYLIKHGRIGCVPGADFGEAGEGYLRFCFARERKELTGALDSMRQLFEENGKGHKESSGPLEALGESRRA